MKSPTNHTNRVMRRCAFALVPAVLLVSVSGALAADTLWTLPGPGSGNWFTPSHWSVDVPYQTYPYYTAIINNGGTATVNSGTANTADLHLGTTGAGSIVQFGGTVDYKQYLYMGRHAGSVGSYTLDAGTLTASLAYAGTAQGFSFIGYNGTGTFIQNGGTHNAGEIFIGYSHNSVGTYELHDGTLDTSGTAVGDLGPGTFTHTSGLHVSGGDNRDGGIRIGTSAEGLYELSGDGQVITDGIAIGAYEATGTYRQISGTTTVMDQFGYIGLGGQFGGHGILELQGGSLTTRSIYVAADPPRSSQKGGTGLFNQSGGTATAELLDIGAGGTYLYTGGTMSLSSGLNVDGTIDFDGSSVEITVGDGSVVDLSNATILNSNSASLTIGANTITLLPAGFDPYVEFGSFSTQGVFVASGDDLVVPSGVTITLNGTYDDHVRVEGTVRAPNAGAVVFTGLEVRNGGVVDTRNDAGTYTTSTINVVGDRSAIDSGSIHINNFYVGRQASGKFVQSGGSIAVKQNLTVGEYSGGNGVYELSAGSVTSGGTAVGGGVGVGHFKQTGGTHSTFGYTLDGGAVPGKYDLSGTGVFSVNRQPGSVYESTAIIGSGGKGTMNQSGGSFNVQGSLRIGSQPGSDGKYNLSNGSVSAERIYVGEYYSSFGTPPFIGGIGTLTQTGGSVTTTLGLTIGYVGGTGTYNISGGTLSSAPIRVGDGGKGLFNQTGGSVNAMALFVSFESHNEGSTYQLSDGSAAFSTVEIGRRAQGTFKQSGGIHQAGLLNITPNGRYEFSGGDLNIGWQLNLQGAFDFLNSAATLTLGENSFADLSNGQFLNTGNASIVGGVGSLVQFPAGFDLDTDLGSFSTQGTYHIAGQSLTIQQGQSVHGVGTIIGNVTNAGQVSPGNSPGIISVQGAYTQTENGELEMEIALFDFDKLTVTGNATLDGVLSIIPLAGVSPGVGAQYTIMSFASRTGQFDSVDGYIVDGKYFDAIYAGTNVSIVVRQAVLGDTDLDGDIDLSDLSNLASAYGQPDGADWVNGDFDHDGDVDLNDLSSLASRYGSGVAQAMADFAELTAVPEPTQISACLAFLALAARRRARRR